MFLKEIIKDVSKQGKEIEENKIQKNQNNSGEAIMKNINFVKNLGANEAEYAYSETNCENLCYSPLSDPQFFIPNFTALSFKSSTSINRGSAQFEILDIEQCRGSIEEQITNFQSEMNKYEQKLQFGASQNQIDCIPEEQENKDKQQKFQLVNFGKDNKTIESFNLQCITHIELPECIRDFLVNPYEQNKMIQCLLIRDNSGLNMFTPKYKLLFGEKKQFLMSARKILNKHKYIITQDAEFSRQERATLLGKVEQSQQSSFDYFLFDDGDTQNGSESLFKKKKQLGGVFYSHDNSQKKPRNMTVLIKQNDNENNVVTFESRQPILKKQFDQTIYTLDFYGRVKWPSVKNVQLVKRKENNDEIYFLLGKVNSEEFNLDFKCPLSPLLAFQIALTAFDFQK